MPKDGPFFLHAWLAEEYILRSLRRCPRHHLLMPSNALLPSEVKSSRYALTGGQIWYAPRMIFAVNVEDGPVKEYLYKSGVIWLFNPPHSSHFGGVWERLIGVTRRVLDSMLLEIPPGSLTHEILTTFIAEASAIVNSRPLVPVSTDPEDPLPLSPSLILTHKPDNTVDYIPTDGKDLLRSQWRRVQHLADTFWKRWRTQYLQTLQNYRKWKQEKRNLVIGDVILLKDNSVTRNSWPLGRVVRVFPALMDEYAKQKFV